ncbi:MAG: hypothetical protein UGE21_01770 [Lachnospiraceae bacterium]|jgi:hypothetical protein|nr:hypothetical protein [Lachnospiraceae bacterium]
MLATFQKELLLSSLMFVFLVCSILGKIMLGVLYQNMIKETENMRATKNKRLKQCKLKFVNCYRLNHGVANVPVFVDKYLNQMKIGPVSVNTFYHLCGQTMLLSVLCAGIAVCRSITKSAGLFAVLPYYIVSFLGLYLHFAVSAVVDIRGRRRVLKINLVDFLENHMSMQLAEAELTEEAEEAQDIRTTQKTEGRVKPKTTAVTREEEPEPQEAFSSMNEKELEELLKEFLTL